MKTRVMWILGKNMGVRQALMLEHASDGCWERTGGLDRCLERLEGSERSWERRGGSDR